MYGLLLESIQHYVQEQYGEAAWQRVLEEAGLHNMVFTTHRQYSDKFMLRLAAACSTVLPDVLPSVQRSLHYFGTCFVDFGRVYGYDKILRVAGRHYRDFLHGIDNLHETIRFSYPRMQSPSFIVEQEDQQGCVLAYRSGRKGFAHYVIGQLQQCAKQLYRVNVRITLLQQRDTELGCHVTYRLNFNNTSYNPPPPPGVALKPSYNGMDTVPGSLLFQLFPFCIVFNKQLIIQRVGPSAANLFGDCCLVGMPLTSVFILRRPLVDFTWNNIIYLQNVIFELESRPEVDAHLGCKERGVSIELYPESHLRPALARQTAPSAFPQSLSASQLCPVAGQVALYSIKAAAPRVGEISRCPVQNPSHFSGDGNRRETQTEAPGRTAESDGKKDFDGSNVSLLKTSSSCLGHSGNRCGAVVKSEQRESVTARDVLPDLTHSYSRRGSQSSRPCGLTKSSEDLRKEETSPQSPIRRTRSQEICDRKSACKKLLKGQMKLIPEWGHIAFLCTPLVSNLEELQQMNMYLNDLNMYDHSRDLVLQGHNHAPLLESLMEQQVAVTKKIRENLRALDKARMDGNKLLYSMLPETIAVRLKQGENPINTCQTFDTVTILFSYLVGFKDICSNGVAMDVVRVINNSFTVFDPIVDKYGLYKVETLGDAVYMVAGGVPDPTEDHAQRVANLALDFVAEAHRVKCPIENKSLTVRIGMHTGSIVAGVVGKRTPQYCLFGDTVNTAARLQSHSLPGRTHLSEPCHQCLKHTDLVTVYRGQVNVKGKGVLNTYWLAGRKGAKSTECNTLLFHKERDQDRTGQEAGSLDFDLHALHASSSSSSMFQSAGNSVSPDDSECTPTTDTPTSEAVFTMAFKNSASGPQQSQHQRLHLVHHSQHSD